MPQYREKSLWLQYLAVPKVQCSSTQNSEGLLYYHYQRNHHRHSFFPFLALGKCVCLEGGIESYAGTVQS